MRRRIGNWIETMLERLTDRELARLDRDAGEDSFAARIVRGRSRDKEEKRP